MGRVSTQSPNEMRDVRHRSPRRPRRRRPRPRTRRAARRRGRAHENAEGALEQIKKSGNICPSGALAAGVKGQKTLDDNSADCTDQDKILLAPDTIGSKKSDEFILLLIVLYHEATHALQDLSKFGASDYKDDEDGVSGAVS